MKTCFSRCDDESVVRHSQRREKFGVLGGREKKKRGSHTVRGPISAEPDSEEFIFHRKEEKGKVRK